MAGIGALLVAACGRSPEIAAIPEPVAPSMEGGPSSPARASVAPRNGLEVVGAMRRAHPSRALRAIAFTLDITDARGDSGSVSRQARAVASMPGKYRVTHLPTSRRSGTVRDKERMTVFEGGKRVGSHNRVDVAHLLAYDIFAQGIDATIQWLDVARVRFALARRDRFMGRDVWVVGANEGDSISTQFWVDADRWRLVRVIQRDPRRPADLLDIRYRDFKDVLRIPVPTEVHIYRNGRPAQQYVISNLIPNPSVPSRAFDLSRWRDVRIAN